jgi:flagellar M-ring protein FliF
MAQISKLIASLSVRQRITLLLTAAGVIAGLIAFARWNRERDFRPLYTGLSAEDAGAVLTRLKETGVEYRLAENGSTVLAPSAKVAEVRLQMAAAGLPKSGRIGFELFDKTNFGTTDFAEQVNYHRALEGELERSVMALADVEQARVHITLPKDSIFTESRRPAKASVLVKLRPGGRLSAQHVAAICQLTSSAVEGLDPESVSVVDMRGNLLNRARRAAGSDGVEASEASIEYRQHVERDLLAKIHSTLEPLLGAEHFRAGVFAECDFSTAEQSEEVLDPARSVMVTSQRTEDISGAAAASGVPGTASNLPRPTSRPGGSPSGVTRRTENISYQSSRTVKRVRIPQGSIKRLSISLLVDHGVRWEGSLPTAKRIVEPPAPEKLKVIRDLVAAVTGFSQERGDQLIVESLPFGAANAPEPPAAAPGAPSAAPPALTLPAWVPQFLRKQNPAVLAGIALAAVVVLLAAVVLLLRRLLRRKKIAVAVQPALPGATALEKVSTEEQQLKKQMEDKLAEQAALKEKLAKEALISLKFPTVSTQKTEVLTKHISDEARKDPSGLAQIVRTWLNDME